MPIGDVFLSVLYKAWNAQSKRERVSLSPRSLLGTLGKKYDQYLDFAQQDAHEFLRILLDAMRMEELDVCVLESFYCLIYPSQARSSRYDNPHHLPSPKCGGERQSYHTSLQTPPIPSSTSMSPNNAKRFLKRRS